MSKLSIYNSVEICCATCLDNFKHFVACKYKIVQKILLKINPACVAIIWIFSLDVNEFLFFIVDEFHLSNYFRILAKLSVLTLLIRTLV